MLHVFQADVAKEDLDIALLHFVASVYLDGASV